MLEINKPIIPQTGFVFGKICQSHQRKLTYFSLVKNFVFANINEFLVVCQADGLKQNLFVGRLVLPERSFPKFVARLTN